MQQWKELEKSLLLREKEGQSIEEQTLENAIYLCKKKGGGTKIEIHTWFCRRWKKLKT